MSDPHPPINTTIAYTATIHQDIFDTIKRLESRVDILTARVHMLELGAGTLHSTDELADKIMEFLKCHKGIKFNTGTVAANINGKSERVSAKLRTLSSHGLLKYDKIEGHSQMFWYEETPDGSVESL